MVEKVKCPNCHELNDIHKFCVNCGKQLFMDDRQMKLITDNPEPYCLNCGRPVKKGKTKCGCGYEFADIECPNCKAKVPYANRFCTSCGIKLWRSNVYDYRYDESHFEKYRNIKLPRELRNISIFGRNKNYMLKPIFFGKAHFSSDLQVLQYMDSMADKAFSEIRSRWKIVSPDYCINCLGIIDPDRYSCPNCGSVFSGDKKRVDFLQNKINNYVEPTFDMVENKCSFTCGDNYLGSLAPSIGESQFEYRERLKWDFAKNVIYKKERDRQRALDSKHVEKPKMEMGKGGYCGFGCSHFFEEYLDSRGGIVGDFDECGLVDYYCRLGHPISRGRYCEDYE